MSEDKLYAKVQFLDIEIPEYPIGEDGKIEFDYDTPRKIFVRGVGERGVRKFNHFIWNGNTVNLVKPQFNPKSNDFEIDLMTGRPRAAQTQVMDPATGDPTGAFKEVPYELNFKENQSVALQLPRDKGIVWQLLNCPNCANCAEYEGESVRTSMKLYHIVDPVHEQLVAEQRESLRRKAEKILFEVNEEEYLNIVLALGIDVQAYTGKKNPENYELGMIIREQIARDPQLFLDTIDDGAAKDIAFVREAKFHNVIQYNPKDQTYVYSYMGNTLRMGKSEYDILQFLNEEPNIREDVKSRMEMSKKSRLEAAGVTLAKPGGRKGKSNGTTSSN